MYLIKVVIKDSTIDGKGVFTLQDIKAGDVVWKFDPQHDQTLTRPEFDALDDKERETLRRVAYLSQNTGRWVYPPAEDPALYTNHSRENNLSAISDKSLSEEPVFIANRDIAVGEELTNNYSEFDDGIRKDIFTKIKELGFPPDQYIVVGSGILAAKGIRQTNDLDIVVTPELFEECKSEGWEVLPWIKEGIPGKDWLRKGDVEVYVQLSRKTGGISAQELLKNAEIIEGVPFITLESLIDFKREYGRPKDFEDIRLVEAYIQDVDTETRLASGVKLNTR